MSSHPEDLNGHSGVLGTLSLTSTGVSSLSLGFVNSLDSRLGVHLDVLPNDEAVLEQLPDVLS